MQSALGTLCVYVFIHPGRIRLDFRELVSARNWAGDREEKTASTKAQCWELKGTDGTASLGDCGSMVDMARMEGSITCHPAPLIHFIPHLLHV